MTRSIARAAAFVLAAGVAVSQAPVNDEPAGAIFIGDGYAGMFSNAGATNSVGYTATCGSGANADVFFIYYPSVSGQHGFSTCIPAGGVAGTLGDSILNIYDVANPTVSLACNDDQCSNPGLGSFASYPLVAGNAYYIRVSRYSTNPDGTFHLEAVPPAPLPLADTCAAAPFIGLGYTQVDMTGATASNPSPVCASFTTANPDVWAAFAAPITATLQIHRENDGITRLAVYTGACGAEVAVAGTNTCVNSTAAAGLITKFNAVAGTLYYIRIGTTGTSTSIGWINLEYEFSLSITKTPVGPGLASLTLADVAGNPNELVVNALTLVPGAYPNGWFYGVDVPVFELLNYGALGAPFFMVLDGSGAASYVVPLVPDPLGFNLYGVAVSFSLSGIKTKHSQPISVSL